MAPCVLWVDEIEKGLAIGDQDGGTAHRVLGMLLTWMAENRQPVFLVATANDVRALPPELVRKGRLDEIFFVDLPGPEARARILDIHFRKRRLDPQQFDLAALASISEGFSGAELEQAVVAALYIAHAQRVALTTAHVAAEVQRTRPLAVVMAERIAALRTWAAERTVPAD
jgi:SpoVK/Ycf46/Vps4 family AAA+-type ATPase